MAVISVCRSWRLRPAFEKALYALNKDQVSEPVRTDFGYHLIKLLGVEAPEVPTFASLKDKLTRELKTNRSSSVLSRQPSNWKTRRSKRLTWPSQRQT
jgi:hypothetical protein